MSTNLQRYSHYRPTQFDSAGLGIDDRQDWYVAPVVRTRDSLPLELSNFAVALKEFGGESRYVEVHRFGHWGPGWFELILIKPTAKRTVQKAVDIGRALADYPVLDDMHHSQTECEYHAEYGCHNECDSECGYIPDITADDCEIELTCEPELESIEGNCSAIDPEIDRETEEWIRSELESGNEWAWCTVTVTVRWEDHEASDSLGCCSYKSEKDFQKNSGYYADMIAECIAEIRKQLKEGR